MARYKETRNTKDSADTEQMRARDKSNSNTKETLAGDPPNKNADVAQETIETHKTGHGGSETTLCQQWMAHTHALHLHTRARSRFGGRGAPWKIRIRCSARRGRGALGSGGAPHC